MNVIEIGYSGGRWLEMIQDNAQWWSEVLAVLSVRVLSPKI